MAYNNYMDYRPYFPQSYQPYSQYQQPNMQVNGNPINNVQSQQMMTPPTIHAEIVQVSGREEALNFSVGIGQTQMMMAKDESSIFIKTTLANGQSTVIEYARKPEESGPAQADYITREEFERRITEIMKSATVQDRRDEIDE